MTELTLFAYPWDLAHDGGAETVALARSLGATRLAVAATYHSAEIVSPRERGPVVTHVEANRAHLPLPHDAFSDLRLPASQLARTTPTCFPELAVQAAGASLGLTGWVIALHNSSLAQEHPDVALENCFGDRSAHGLCPANPRTRTYVQELVAAVAHSGHFDRLLIESASFLLAGHGHPHELAAVRIDARTRLLLSLCFCPSCLEQAARRDIDAERVRDRCAHLLHRTWNAPLSPSRAPDEGLELAELLATDADLAAFARMRLDVVSELVERLAAALHADGSELLVTTAVWGRPAPLNWTEGVDLARTGRAADQVVLTTYDRDPAVVARDLDHVLEHVAPERVMQLNTLWPAHHASAAELLAKVELGLDAGVRAFGLYNLGTAPAPTREWARDVATRLAAA